jgi:hypothetical protein
MPEAWLNKIGMEMPRYTIIIMCGFSDGKFSYIMK